VSFFTKGGVAGVLAQLGELEGPVVVRVEPESVTDGLCCDLGNDIFLVGPLGDLLATETDGDRSVGLGGVRRFSHRRVQDGGGKLLV